MVHLAHGEEKVCKNIDEHKYILSRAIFHFLNRLSVVVVVVVVGHLRTSDDNDLEHVMNTESSLETGPFATFRPPPRFYNLFKLFFYID